MVYEKKRNLVAVPGSDVPRKESCIIIIINRFLLIETDDVKRFDDMIKIIRDKCKVINF